MVLENFVDGFGFLAVRGEPYNFILNSVSLLPFGLYFFKRVREHREYYRKEKR